jgi:hypothetical protein
MNERIKELYKQAHVVITAYDPSNNMLPYETTVLNVEKFAELIVRECMSLCTDVEEDVELADYVGGFRDGALMCREDIKQHFGVEE